MRDKAWITYRRGRSDVNDPLIIALCGWALALLSVVYIAGLFLFGLLMRFEFGVLLP
jgi:hypothetical protein